MTLVPTVGITELAQSCSLQTALESWSGFVELGPASQACTGVGWIELPNSPNASWRQVGGMAASPIQPIGCSFLHDIEISGSGYLFADKCFIREFVHTSDVALQWLERPDYTDNPLIKPRTNHLVIDDPVLQVFGPGSNIFGHWLLDFLPRIVIAQKLLGRALNDFVLLLPSDVPDWVIRMIKVFCGWEPRRVHYYSRMDDAVLCRCICLPSFAHNGNYALHPLVRDFYDRFKPAGMPLVKRRICLSRRNQERHTFSTWRILEARETMERMAATLGFEIVQAEVLSFPEQVALFRSADCILGEHGSGMHAAVFANPGTVVGTVGAFNGIQFHISAAFEHRMVCMRRVQVMEQMPGQPLRLTVTEDDLGQLLAIVDQVARQA